MTSVAQEFTDNPSEGAFHRLTYNVVHKRHQFTFWKNQKLNNLSCTYNVVHKHINKLTINLLETHGKYVVPESSTQFEFCHDIANQLDRRI